MSPDKVISFDQEEGMRLDKWLASSFTDTSRETWKGRIKEGKVQVNGMKASPSRVLVQGDQVSFQLLEEESPVHEAFPLPLKVLFEDEWLVIVDKPAGLVVHPAHGHPSGTLVNAILASYPGLSDLAGKDRPGIVHRLDKDTSGIILIARNNESHKRLADLFRKGEIDRFYQAIVRGRPGSPRGLIDLPIGRGDVYRKRMEVREDGKKAMTSFEVLASSRDYSRLSCRLMTGRTHQIRVHLAAIGHPVVGDPLYGGKRRPEDPPFQLLHAFRLSFTHPMTGQLLDCQSPLPDRFLPFLAMEEDDL